MSCGCQNATLGARPPLRLGDPVKPKGGGSGMLWLMGGILAAWAVWAAVTPHEEYRS
jgi:hypothetical protein